MKRLELKIFGRVQGVFYRAETQEKAVALGLSGFGRNEADGSVTVVAVGQESALKKLEDWCRQGPERAQVENVEAKYEEPKPEEKFTSFEIY